MYSVREGNYFLIIIDKLLIGVLCGEYMVWVLDKEK